MQPLPSAARPVSQWNAQPCQGQVTTPSTTSPWAIGPPSCGQTPSRQRTSDPTRNSASSRPSTCTRTTAVALELRQGRNVAIDLSARRRANWARPPRSSSPSGTRRSRLRVRTKFLRSAAHLGQKTGGSSPVCLYRQISHCQTSGRYSSGPTRPRLVAFGESLAPELAEALARQWCLRRRFAPARRSARATGQGRLPCCRARPSSTCPETPPPTKTSNASRVPAARRTRTPLSPMSPVISLGT